MYMYDKQRETFKCSKIGRQKDKKNMDNKQGLENIDDEQNKIWINYTYFNFYFF